jgi:hypothetical protein
MLNYISSFPADSGHRLRLIRNRSRVLNSIHPSLPPNFLQHSNIFLHLVWRALSWVSSEEVSKFRYAPPGPLPVLMEPTGDSGEESHRLPQWPRESLHGLTCLRDHIHWAGSPSFPHTPSRSNQEQVSVDLGSEFSQTSLSIRPPPDLSSHPWPWHTHRSRPFGKSRPH